MIGAASPADLQSLLHSWPTTPTQALLVQDALRHRVIRDDAVVRPVRHVAGIDVAYASADGAAGDVYAGVVVLDARTLEPLDSSSARCASTFPYLPGLFAFRELPAVLRALQGLTTRIDLLVCDAQGIAHPRRFGLAAHLGVLLDLPSIGVAKTRLIGAHDPPGHARGSHADLIDGDERVGAVLRTQDGVKPVYVSIGHRVSLGTAIDWTLRLSPHYRLPETTRHADRLVNALRRLRMFGAASRQP